jgi:hypothetical protein
MTILPFVRPETTFDPDAVAIMSSAFDAALASLNVQHLVRDEGVAGSNPATPTSFLAV